MVKLNIKEWSEKKVLCTRICFEEKVMGTNARFGFEFDCHFDDNGIRINYYGDDKLKECSNEMLAEEFIIPYSEIQHISFSISRKPINILFLVKPYDYALDMNIVMNKDFCNHSICLETCAFTVINDLCTYLQEKNVCIEDQLNILENYSGTDYEKIKLKLNEDYDGLKEKYNLVNFRMTADKE